jgi:hypothetical protein
MNNNIIYNSIMECAGVKKMTKEKGLEENFEDNLIDCTVTFDDLHKHNYQFLGIAKGKDGYKELHVFNKDKEYYYFKFHKDYHVLDDEYEFIIKSDYKAANIVKE